MKMNSVSPGRGRRASASWRKAAALKTMEPPEYKEEQEGTEDSLKLSNEASDLADLFSGAMHARTQLKLWTNCVRAKRKIGIKKDGSGTIDVSADRYVPVTGYVKLNEMGICELGSDVEDEVLPLDSQSQDEREKARKHNTRVTQSQALLHYFAKLARSDDSEEEIDIEFVDNLIQGGADVNTRDVFGQSLLHEVARAWHTSVAIYFIEMGADINSRDYLGRTPLHVAAAVDYCDMIDTLLDYGAVLESLTFEENQTPLHFAARNDSSNALVKLIKCRADIEARDYKMRTPLHVAAELDRSDTARLLLEYGANAGVVDSSGMSAIVLMVRKMSPVAKEALDQFHKKDRANRKQLFFLEKLEHVKAEAEGVHAHSVLKVVVDHNKLDLITHPIFEKLIQVKWDYFGWRGALWQLFINVLFVFSWTIQALSEPSGDPAKYDLPQDIFRIALYVISVMLWLYMFISELFELYDSKKAFKKWYDWRKHELEKDFKYLHQRWPEEENYFHYELNALQTQEPSYFQDFWNIFDWITYAILIFQLILHVIDVLFHNNFLTNVQRGVFAIAIILVWVRLMKSFRAFRAVGPFIVICTYMIKDIFRWLFLYLIFYTPYCVAFFMIFGGDNIAGYKTFNDVMFSMLRITLVDDYNFEGLEEKHETMARILCGSFLMISAIVMLNLFIALLSDTFQRVYDNAQANALLQQASFIQAEEEGLSGQKLNRFRDYIHNKCAPLKEYYDDDWEDNSDDLKKVTIQIKEILQDYLEDQEDLKRDREMSLADERLQPDLELLYSMVRTAMRNTGRKASHEIRSVRKEINELKALVASATGSNRVVQGNNSRQEDHGVSSESGEDNTETSDDDDGDSDGASPPIVPALRVKQLKMGVSGTRRQDSQASITPRGSLISSHQHIPKGIAEEQSDNVDQSEERTPPNDEVSNTKISGVSSDRNEMAVSAVPQRPRQRLRQIQVVPEDEEDEVLSRYGHVDFSADNPVTRVNVRTRPVVMPPAYSSRNVNPNL